MKTTFKGVAIALYLAATLAGCTSTRPNEPTTPNGNDPGVPFVIDPATGAVVSSPVQPDPVNPATGSGNIPSAGGGGGTGTPNQPDSDGDGIPDANDQDSSDPDSDGDGIPDSVDSTYGPPPGSASPRPGLPTVF